MITKLTAEKPDSIEMTLTITMSLKEWKELRQQLSRDYPSWELGSKISQMTDKATKHFYPDVPPA